MMQSVDLPRQPRMLHRPLLMGEQEIHGEGRSHTEPTCMEQQSSSIAPHTIHPNSNDSFEVLTIWMICRTENDIVSFT